MAVKEYAVPLRLTTPHMKGIPVRDAQWLMKGNTRFGKKLAPYKDGKIDEDYGQVTSQATKRLKFWVGYPTNALDTVFGQTLYEYVRPEKWRPLPTAFKLRRDARLKAAAETPGLAAFKLAATQIGYKEEPRHHMNDNKYGRWYGFNRVPWCAIFESWCFYHSGWKSFRFAAVEQIYYAAASGRNGLRLVYTPQTGDIVGYGFYHTAFYSRKIDGTRFEDLGGNTGPSSISNGGGVMKQNRAKNLVRFYARIA